VSCAYWVNHMPPLTGVSRQCFEHGLPIEVLRERVAPGIQEKKRWVATDGSLAEPELLVLERYMGKGWHGSWCEGGTLNLAMKSAALLFLTKYNFFNNPADAIRRYFEAQCELLKDRR